MLLKRSAKDIVYINLLFMFCFFVCPAYAKTNYYEALKELAGKNGAVYVADRDGTAIVKINETKKLAPASILKIITASAAYHYLNADFRFKTEFYLDDKNNLYIKGYGDPTLISEELYEISAHFKEKGVVNIKSIYLDNSYFDGNIKIDGVEKSLNPYDATNGALSVNFNTINVTVKKNGDIITAEPQTPMTDFGRELVKKRLKPGREYNDRIILSHERGETLLYTGHLFKEFLVHKGIRVAGEIKKRIISKDDKVRLFYTHRASKSLDEVVASMMKYSNNFTANQLFLTTGAHVYGAPATVKKGVDAILRYLKEMYGITDAVISEGSGISRKNHISSLNFIKILYNYRDEHIETLNGQYGIFYKTGTLNDVKSAAGFVRAGNGDIYSFVVMLNDERDINKRSKIIKLIKSMISGHD